MCDFTYGFEDLEFAPGLMATGEADFIKRPDGSFLMNGLSLFWKRANSIMITHDSDWVWQAIETALVQMDDRTGCLQSAYEKAEESEREYLITLEADYAREERNIGL